MAADFEIRRESEVLKSFESTIEEFNDVLAQFSLDYILTVNGFSFRQDERINREIITPVLSILAGSRWKPVNLLLQQSFADYREQTPVGYTNSITNAVSALEAFLQISLYDEIGKGTLGSLVSEGIKLGKIPDDNFSKSVIQQLTSFLAKERKETGTPHPKVEFSTEKNCRLLINVVMIFIQHAIQ